MKFDEKAGYAGNSQRVNQDCLHAHIPEDSVMEIQPTLHYQIGPARQPPHVNRLSVVVVVVDHRNLPLNLGWWW